jgi:hypothetical protein
MPPKLSSSTEFSKDARAEAQNPYRSSRRKAFSGYEPERTGRWRAVCATSRLFERGYEIHEVQQFTLHSSWQQLLRYTHLRPEQIPDLPYNSPPLPDRQPLAAWTVSGEGFDRWV